MNNIKWISDEISSCINSIIFCKNQIKYFFSSGVTDSTGEGMSSNSIKTFIKEIIDSEDPKKPYSDQDMVEILGSKGIEISRRTVAKYREGIL